MKRLLPLLLVAILAGFFACSRNPEKLPASTAIVYSNDQVRQQVPFAVCGDTAYAQVNSVWLKEFYPDFRAELFRQGVVKWDERFDCNHFATYYAALAQTRFYLASWGSSTTAQSLAVGTFWYQAPRGGHAIIVAITERGRIFIEPQTGEEVKLTPAQIDSAFFRLF